MKKIITILILTFLLFSCENNIEKKEIVKEKTKAEIEKEAILEIEEYVENMWKKLPKYKTKKKVTEKWKKENIWKLNCKAGNFVLKEHKYKIADFRSNKETKVLQKKVDNFNKREDIIWWFSYFISEFCKNKESNKYIFWTQDKPIFTFWRYDKNLDIIEPAEFKYKVFDLIGGAKFFSWYNIVLEKYYNKYLKKHKFTWFWKRVWNKIEIKDFWRPITKRYKELDKFLKEKNKKYCYNWLTPKWNKAICFADVYYSYDFVENILTEDKICTYYIDDDWGIKTLEGCRKFSY